MVDYTMSARPRREAMSYGILASLMSSLASAILAIAISFFMARAAIHRADERAAEAQAEAIRQSEQKLCSMMVAVDDAYKTRPGPTSVVGKEVANAVHETRVKLNCPGK